MKSFFTAHGIAFTAKDISRDNAAYREWRDKFNGDVVPLVVFRREGKIVDGADIPKIKNILRQSAATKENR